MNLRCCTFVETLFSNAQSFDAIASFPIQKLSSHVASLVASALFHVASSVANAPSHVASLIVNAPSLV